MALVEMRVDLSNLIDAVASGNSQQIIAAAREQLADPELLAQIHNREAADTLLGRVGMVAAHGDPDGHPVMTLAAAAHLCRLLPSIPEPLEGSAQLQMRSLPLFVQGLLTAAPAVQKGQGAAPQYPDPFFPSDLEEGKPLNDLFQQAIQSGDTNMVERLLFGLYGTGADYRTLQIRVYEALATSFQDGGHPLMLAVRGFQLLDTVEWGIRVPNILHWLAPHMPLNPKAPDPAWIADVKSFSASNSLASVRTRLAAPKNENARSLRQLILSDASTTQICQGVYDAVIKGGASPQAVGSIITLAAADIVERVGNDDRDLFLHAAHALLFASAASLVFRQVQDVEALPLLYTSAAAVNALQKEIATSAGSQGTSLPTVPATPAGGGLIAAAQLETLEQQLKARSLPGALTIAQRYIKLGHSPRALFGTIGAVAALNDTTTDQGHTLQIVHAAGEAFISWPADLKSVNPEPLLRVALRAATFGQRNPLIEQLS